MVEDKPRAAVHCQTILQQVLHKNSPKLSKITFLIIFFGLYFLVNSINACFSW